MSELSVEVFHKKTCYIPVVKDGSTWQTDRRGAPGQFNFTVIQDHRFKCSEGDAVRVRYGSFNVFFGFVFKMTRSKSGEIQILAYDQERYLKNKAIYTGVNKTASQIIKELAEDYQLKLGSIANTGHKIKSTVEDNKALFDIIDNALTRTLQHTKTMYVLYDDFGKLTLKKLSDMKVKSGKGYFCVTKDNSQDYSLVSSIDQDVYDSVALYYHDQKSGKTTYKFVSDKQKIKEWGVLQLVQKVESKEGMATQAKQMLELYKEKTRTLEINGVKGYPKVRGGSMILLDMSINGLTFKNFMVVEKAKHTWKDSLYTMDLNLRGGVINSA